LKELTITQRLLISNLLTMCAFSANLKYNPMSLIIGLRNGLLTFGLANWILVPEIGEKYLSMLS
jgi:hypothetical protein